MSLKASMNLTVANDNILTFINKFLEKLLFSMTWKCIVTNDMLFDKSRQSEIDALCIDGIDFIFSRCNV